MNKTNSDSSNDISPNVYAKTGGVLYVIMIILGIIQEVVIRGRIIVSGNVAMTASNLKSMEPLWRYGIAIELVMIIITICLALIIYVLTKPVNQNLAVLAAFFNLVAISIGAAYTLQLVEALFPLGSAQYLSAFTPEQLNAMSSMLLKAHGLGFGISLLMYGPFFLITGYLLLRSGYFPKTLGILYIIPGFSYTISSFMLFLAPALAEKYYFFVAGPALIGELSLALWLIFKGVNLEKWKTKIAAFK